MVLALIQKKITTKKGFRIAMQPDLGHLGAEDPVVQLQHGELRLGQPSPRLHQRRRLLAPARRQARRLRVGGVHLHPPALHNGAVQRLPRLRGLAGAAHADEAEALGAALVGDHLCVRHHAGQPEEPRQLQLPPAKGDVGDVEAPALVGLEGRRGGAEALGGGAGEPGGRGQGGAEVGGQGGAGVGGQGDAGGRHQGGGTRG